MKLFEKANGVTLKDRMQLLLFTLRRIFLIRFRPNYVAYQFAHRLGACNKCGECCKVGMYKCKYLSANGSCLVYSERAEKCPNLPMSGAKIVNGVVDDLFPIDEREMKTVKNCGQFKWRF